MYDDGNWTAVSGHPDGVVNMIDDEPLADGVSVGEVEPT
jgi:hypothetical protein